MAQHNGIEQLSLTQLSSVVFGAWPSMWCFWAPGPFHVVSPRSLQKEEGSMEYCIRDVLGAGCVPHPIGLNQAMALPRRRGACGTVPSLAVTLQQSF